MTAVAAAAALVCVLLLCPAAPSPSPLRWPRVPGWLPVAAGVGLVPFWPGPAVPWLLGLLAGYGGWVLWRRRSHAQAAEERAARVAESCESLVAELRAGRPPGTALARVAADWPDLAPAAAAARFGASVPAALRTVAAAPGAGDVRLVAAAWEVSQRTGHGLAAALERVRRTVRADRATTRVVSAELASARATARLVAVLPLLSLLIGSGVGGDPWGFLLDTPAGWACLAGGLVLGLLGLAWIEGMARGVLEGEG